MQWAAVGARTCRFHGGGTARKIRGTTGVDRLPRFYRSVLNTTLQKVVEESLDCPATEQLQLLEELALMRIAADQSVAMFVAAQESKDEATKVRAASLMMHCLQNVAQLCKDAAAVNQPGVITAHDVQSVVNQITRLAYTAFGDDNPMAQEFDRLLQTQLRVKRPEGTDLTPDMDAIDMDSTIPGGPDA